MKILLTLLLSSFTSFAAEVPDPDVLDPQAFTYWREKPYTTMNLDFAKLQTKPFNCKDTQLIPMGRSQATKEYHHFVWANYELNKVSGRSPVCRLRSKTNANVCLRADTIEYAIMSDTFRDSCGHTYRAYWQVVFLTEDESIGTLFSLGRTMYPKQGGMEGEFEEGPTYPVDRNRFIFFTELFEKDKNSNHY